MVGFVKSDLSNQFGQSVDFHTDGKVLGVTAQFAAVSVTPGMEMNKPSTSMDVTFNPTSSM